MDEGQSKGLTAIPASGEGDGPAAIQADRAAALPDPAPIIVTAQMGPADQAWANALRRRHFPPERNHLDAHITLFHHLPPSCAPELTGLLSDLARQAPPAASIDRLINLGRGVAFHVHSPELFEIRRRIAERFAGLLIPQDQAKPRFHITVQNKVSPQEARDTLAAIGGDFTSRPLRIAGLASWYYRGGPWEAIRQHGFRG